MNAPRFIDTNILPYSISRDLAEAPKREIAIALLDTVDVALSVQVLQEFYVQATRAGRGSRMRAPLVQSHAGTAFFAKRSQSYSKCSRPHRAGSSSA